MRIYGFGRHAATVAALLAFMVYSGTHFAFHAGHLSGYPADHAISQMLTLAAGILLPVPD